MTMFDNIVAKAQRAMNPSGLTPAQLAQQQAAQQVALQNQVAIQNQQDAAAAQAQAMPACLPSPSYQTAQSLCAAKRAAGQEAVAGYGRSLGASDPYAAAIALTPCDWAALPPCPTTPATINPNVTAQLSPTTLTVGPSSVTVSPGSQPALAPAPVAAPFLGLSHGTLIVGGVLLGVLALGGAVYISRKGN